MSCATHTLPTASPAGPRSSAAETDIGMRVPFRARNVMRSLRISAASGALVPASTCRPTGLPMSSVSPYPRSTQVLLEVDALRRHRIRLDQAEELVLDPIGDLAVMRIQLFEQSPEVATPRRVRRGGEVLGGGIVRLALGRPRVDETRLEHEPAHRIAARQVVGPQAPNGRADLERRGLRRIRPAHGLAEARDHGEAGEHPEAEEEREADRDEYGYAFSHRRAGVSV